MRWSQHATSTLARLAACAFALGAIAGCSSSKTPSSDAGGGSSSGSSSGSCNQDLCTAYGAGGCGLSTDAAIDAAVASCAAPGGPTEGTADDHCSTAGDDGGPLAQPVSLPACCGGGDDASAGAGGQSCPYGATMYGKEGDDDDCKYHIVWTSTPICEGAPGARVVMTAFYKTRFDDAGAPLPLTGANPQTEVFTTTPDIDASNYCDDMSSHLGPTNPNQNHLVEGPPGTYTGNVGFDQAGVWTLRFHLNEECVDLSGESPHGHAAFHVTVP